MRLSWDALVVLAGVCVASEQMCCTGLREVALMNGASARPGLGGCEMLLTGNFMGLSGMAGVRLCGTCGSSNRSSS